MSELMENFGRVSRGSPCPVCGKPDWCLLGLKTSEVICMRVPSEKPGGPCGWVHAGLKFAPPSESRDYPEVSGDDIHRIASAAEREYDQAGKDLHLQWGVTRETLRSLGVGWDSDRRYSFPMFDIDADYCGIRFRYEDGRMSSLPGCRNGLFIPFGHAPSGGRVFITEGASDTAVAVEFGLHVIGRPDCNGGRKHVQAYLDYCPEDTPVIVADNDEPGQRGAIRLARKLGRALVVTPKLHGDLRDYYRDLGLVGPLLQAAHGSENNFFSVLEFEG